MKAQSSRGVVWMRSLAPLVYIVTGLLPACPGCAMRTGGAAVLSKAGEAIARSRYVEVLVEYREKEGEEERVVPVKMIFGPSRRIRVDTGLKFGFFDGAQAGMLDEETGELWTMAAPSSYASAIMIAGTVLGGVSLPVPAARDLGGRWWEHLYGADADVQLRDPEMKNGRLCHVVAVQPQGAEPCAVWWIEQDSFLFVGFRVEEGRADSPLEGIVRGDYRLIRFPRAIADEDFRASTLSEDIRRYGVGHESHE